MGGTCAGVQVKLFGVLTTLISLNFTEISKTLEGALLICSVPNSPIYTSEISRPGTLKNNKITVIYKSSLKLLNFKVLLNFF